MKLGCLDGNRWWWSVVQATLLGVLLVSVAGCHPGTRALGLVGVKVPEPRLATSAVDAMEPITPFDEKFVTPAEAVAVQAPD